MSIELVMPSSHLILCHPLLLPPIPPSIRVFSNESALLMRWPKYWMRGGKTQDATGTALSLEKLNHALWGLLGLGSACAVPYLCDSWRDTSKMKR